MIQNLPREVSDDELSKQLQAAAQPMKEQMTQEAPKGQYKDTQGEFVSLRYRGNRYANDYRRGGATKQDVRIKVAKDENGTVKVLVGVSKAAGKVGWRTHFIVQGVAGTKQVAKNPFLDRAHDKTIAQTEDNFLNGVKRLVESHFK